MKFLNDFKNLFAIIGVVSIIFWTCASESTSTNVNPPQLTDGVYQVSVGSTNFGNNNSYLSYLVALNTKTGVMKTFIRTNTSSSWSELTDELTFTH